MPFQSIPSNIVTTKPRTAGLNQTGALSGTYYTVVNVTGTGKLFLARNQYFGTSVSLTSMFIRVTVDGVQNAMQGTTSSMSGYVPNTGTTGTSFEHWTDISFNSSLQVEIMQNAGTFDIYGTVNYALI
jgi:hypothetical protein